MPSSETSARARTATVYLQHPHILPLFDLQDSESVVVDFRIAPATGAAVSPPL